MKKSTLFFSAAFLLALASCGGQSISSTEKISESSVEEAPFSSSAISEEKEDSSPLEDSEKESEKEQDELSSSENEDVGDSLVSSSEDALAYGIDFDLDGHVGVSGAKSEAKAGEKVSFALSFDEGYELSDITVLFSSIALLLEENEGVFSFVMPEGDVTISISSKRSVFILNLVDEHSLIKGDILIQRVGDEEPYAADDLTVEFGARVTLTLGDAGEYKGRGIEIVETKQTLTADSLRQVSFTMPGRNITVVPTYVENSIGFTLVNADHLSIAVLDSNGEMASGAAIGDKVFVRVDSLDPERYSVRDITIYYTLSGNLSSTTTSILSSFSEGLYSFVAPNTESIRISVSEIDSKALEGTPIVGLYRGLGMFGGVSNYTKSNQYESNYNVEISANGDILYHEEVIRYVTGYDDETGVISISSYGSMLYGNNLLIADIDWSSALKSYDLIGVRTIEGDSLDKYNCEVGVYTISGSQYVLINVTRDEANYASAFINKTAKVAYFGVDFLYLNDNESIVDAKSQFEVAYEGETLATISYRGEGGAANRIFAEGLVGDYKDDEDSIRFLGNGYAEFDGVSYTVSQEENQVTLTSNTRKIVIVVDEANLTYAVLTDEEVESGMPFKGHMYRGNFTNSFQDTVYFFMKFDEEEQTYISCAAEDKSDISDTSLPYYRTLHNSTNAYGALVPNSYSYDAASGTMDAALFDAAYNGTLTLVYSSGNDTFTCTNDFSSFYKTKNMVLTLVA